MFYDYKNIGIKCELNPVRTFIKTIPYTRILVSLSIIVDIILIFSNNDIENILDDIQNFRENIIYMLSFAKTVKDEQQKVVELNLIDE